jgi:hypothetical protein
MIEIKKIVLIIGLICLILITILSGCIENDNEKNVLPTQTYTRIAKQVFEDIPLDLDWIDEFQLLYPTLRDRDTLKIKDSISNITYYLDLYSTVISFDWTADNESSSINLVFL